MLTYRHKNLKHLSVLGVNDMGMVFQNSCFKFMIYFPLLTLKIKATNSKLGIGIIQGSSFSKHKILLILCLAYCTRTECNPLSEKEKPLDSLCIQLGYYFIYLN